MVDNFPSNATVDNKSHLPASWQFTSASVNLPGRITRSKSCEDSTERNLFDKSTNQPLFSTVFAVLQFL